MSYLVILRFDNATLFKKSFRDKGSKNSKDSSDRIFYSELSKGKNKKKPTINVHKNLRQKNQWDEVPPGRLGINHVRNVLMVLCGYRPVTKFRPSAYQSTSKIIDNMAKRALVNVETITVYNKRNKCNEYIHETQMVRKAVDNAWNTNKYVLNMAWGECIINGIVLSWERIYQMIGLKVFLKFINLAEDMLECNVLDMMCADVFEKLSFKKSNKKDIFLKMLEKEKNITPFKYLLKPSKSGDMEGAEKASCQGNKALLATMVRFGVSNVTHLHGSISVKVDDYELDLFNQGTGTATLLDGGFVRIEKIVNGSEEIFEPYQKGQLPYEPDKTDEYIQNK